MLKKVIWGAGIFLLAALLLLSAFFFIKEDYTIYQGDEFDVSVELPALFTVTSPEQTEQTLENTQDVSHRADIELFSSKIGFIEITERTLGNGSKFIFERLENSSWLFFPAAVTMVGLENPEFTSWNPTVAEHEYHDVFGVDATVNPFGTLKGADFELLQSNVYLSKKMQASYEDGTSSHLRELSKEVTDLEVSGNSIVKEFWLRPVHLAESWTMISENPLFSSTESEEEWIDHSLHNQTVQLNWLTTDGPFTKLPFSIEPSTKMGYGRAIGRFEDDEALRWNEKDPSAFHETMILNSRVNLLYYLAEFDGSRWPTEYTSTWLKNAYEMKAPYVDTRYNEYVAFYLDETARLYDDEIEQDGLAVETYADYLLSQIEEDQILPTDSGFLIVDYFDEDEDTPLTHASLNHELGGLKILLQAYGDTDNAEYLEAAELVTAGIEEFNQEAGGWIRETGDLWYQARPDGTFSGDDYPQLTLLDLLETQLLLEELGMERNVYFDEMIASKLGYLESEGIELIEKVTSLME